MSKKTVQEGAKKPALRNKISNIQNLSMVAFMAAMIGAGAYVFIPLGAVPVTFQDFFVILAGLVLGPVRGSMAVLLYIVAGSLGLPVFSGGRAGIGHLLGPTGGYIVGYVLLAFFSGFGGKVGRKILRSTLASALQKHDTHSNKSASAGPKFESAVSVPPEKVSITLHLKQRLGSLLGAFIFVVLGAFCLYALGGLWLMHSLDKTLAEAVAIGVVPFLPFGISKAVLVVLIWQKLLSRGVIGD